MAGALRGKVSLITGAGTGIGKAVCELFAKEGAIVVGIGLNDTLDEIHNLPNINNLQHSTYNCDVSSESSVKSIFEQVYKDYKKLPTVAVNCAGITKDNLLIRITEQDFDDVINVNLKGTFFVTKHMCSMLFKNKEYDGSIVNIASIVGKTGNIGQAHYTASKAGVVGLTKTTALEFARYGIRCNAILPGFITTPMTDKVPDDMREKVRKIIPLQKFGSPDDIAEACLFLASDKSRYITGTTLEVADHTYRLSYGSPIPYSSKFNQSLNLEKCVDLEHNGKQGTVESEMEGRYNTCV